MRIRRKTKDCLNCGLSLNEIYHYCPRCGQENNDQNVSFGMLVSEFFINYFSFDTKFVRSIKPFIILPGFLTVRFNEGKRVSYVNPLRLYLIISVIFFFLSTLLVQNSFSDISIGNGNQDLNAAVQGDSIPTVVDSAVISKWEIFTNVLEDETLNDQQALDSLQTVTEININPDSWLGPLAFRQLRKVARKDFDVFAVYVVQNMPIMMFLLLPLFALILKILYIRHKHLYVNHLIHGIHLHAFAFLLFTVTLLTHLLINLDDLLVVWAIVLLQFLIHIYVLLSLKKVYKQGWLKTIFKLFILSNVYGFVLFIFGLSETIISFLIF